MIEQTDKVHKETISSLRPGERGIIQNFSVDHIPLKLQEMGCLPGNEVLLIQWAPFKDPLFLSINGNNLAIRKEMAALIEISKVLSK
ncbi:FeoA family protein [Sunxiuqinia elliptica]|uniref:Ferrous iron transport protein A n=1 Tax=Sunxiuqinia elliptica TaxID=655355 RepID=A0A1I2HDT2_9BACT|nr:FeoA family protein [Sunxiuqinia elliptica]SFF27077.1 ferrous iron transport protein A [Sunxiuqinia elliptica]